MSLQFMDFTPCFYFGADFCVVLFGQANCWVKLPDLAIDGAGQMEGL